MIKMKGLIKMVFLQVTTLKEFTQVKHHDGVLWGVDKEGLTWCKAKAQITDLIREL